MAAEPRLGGGHQAWTLNEVNGLIWPSPDGIGVVATEAWDAMVQTMLETDLLTTAPTADAFRTELAIAAGAGLVGQDVTGDAFVKGTCRSPRAGSDAPLDASGVALPSRRDRRRHAAHLDAPGRPPQARDPARRGHGTEEVPRGRA
jgi:hypothetical protein